MTIPPASERAVRPCLDLEGDVDCIFIKMLNCSKECYPDGEYRRARPCPRHFTNDEIWELIDQHNQQELTPRFYGPNEIADLIAEDMRKQDQLPTSANLVGIISRRANDRR